MNHLPVIRIELDGVRHTVNAMLQTRNDELNAMVLASLEKQMKMFTNAFITRSLV